MRFIALAALPLLLASCASDERDYSDPREGKVYLGMSSLRMDWKMCLGPDLVFRVGGVKHVVENSNECRTGDE